MKLTLSLSDGECFWGGSSDDGLKMPFTRDTAFEADHRYSCHNQGMPLFLSNRGRVVWSETPIAFSFANGTLTVESDSEITLTTAGNTLRDAYLYAAKTYFPFTGKVPPETFFRTAQYNSWMQFTYDPTEAGILDYAEKILANGFDPGILIIDEGWHRPYGDWDFDRVKFPHPKEMIDKLHAMGFTVMLWVVPFVRADGVRFASAIRKDLNPATWDKLFLRTEDGKVALTKWWNGFSAILDLTDEDNRNYLESQLRALMQNYGVDGFKFDGGTIANYDNHCIANGKIRGTAEGTYSPMKQNIAWNEFGTRFDFHEFKDTYKGGGKPSIQRLRDRGHRWNEGGIDTILPNSLAQGLIGHPFICPDMIGGGEWSFRAKGLPIDEELFIRMAQISVFFPMMQFSWAPWEALSESGFATVRNAAKLHTAMAEDILAVIRESAVTGEPVVRSMEYEFPDKGYERINDQYLCGKNILVCPVVTKGTFEKAVQIPAGEWIAPDGKVYTEGVYTLPTPIDSLLWFKRK